MKRKILISALLLLTGLVTHAQDLDIKPSQQVQGILESKNAMVDHATGLFHYKVPLYEIKSGNFTLPISLDYVAKGVKVDDSPSTFGYNWTLNTGGVVSRTIRGGIADEEPNGYAMNPLSLDLTQEEITALNTNERDGESDIYTASFNGQTVHFIIKKENTKIIAEPLEKTNVKIDVLYYFAITTNITGFAITDTQGNKYTFSIPEMTNNVIKEGLSESGSIPNKSYISSWYLSKIEPLNSSPIIFEYDYEKLVERKYSATRSLFEYGMGISEYSFVFDKEQFYSYINLAKGHMNNYGILEQVNNPATIFEDKAWRENPNYEIAMKNVLFNFRVMGIMSDFASLSNVSQDIIDILNQVISAYKSNNSYDAQMVIYYLEQAKSVVFRSFGETEYLMSKEEFGGMTYLVYRRLLSKIKHQNKTINFKYKNSIFLDKIELMDNTYKAIISSIKLDNYNTLDKISFVGSDGIEYENLKFTYYSGNNDGINDFWGYPKPPHYPENTNIGKSIEYDYNVDINYSKNKSLSSILSSKGNEIKLEYESNTIKNDSEINYFEYGEIKDFGGIRIKQITIKDNATNLIDVIKYRYPTDGRYIYINMYNTKILHYNNFSDLLTTNYFMNDGVAYINYGNNGIYYPYVEEESVGKGTKLYSFFVPMSNYFRYFFWFYGLHLSTITYDNENRLLNIVKKYYTNFNDESGVIDSAYRYDKSIMQVQADQYHINKVKTEAKFRSQGMVFLYKDGDHNRYINPYNDVYIPNILPRATENANWIAYMLNYGGKTLLKKQIEYNFETQSPGSVNISDFDKSSPNFTGIEYFYDNSANSLFPIKIIKTNSNGNQEIDIIKRVTEMSNTKDPIIAGMISKNILDNIIINQKIIKKENEITGKLVNENVFQYKKEYEKYFDLDRIYTYYPKNPTNIDLTIFTPDNTLFKYNISDYKLDKVMGYNLIGNNYLPVSSTTDNLKNVINYDYTGVNIILNCTNQDYNSVASYDYRKFMIIGSNDQFAISYSKRFTAFYSEYSKLNINNCSAKFKNYTNSEEHKNIIKIMKNFILKENRLSYADIMPLIESTINDTSIQTFETNYRLEFPIINQDYDCNDGFIYVCFYLFNVNQMQEDEYNSLFVWDKSDLIKSAETIRKNSELNITNVCSSKQYKLYVYGYCLNCNLNIHSSSGDVIEELSIPVSYDLELSILDLDLSNYANIQSLKINNISQGALYIAIVPADAEFEATSYNTDGTVFCKFNQNGQLERYEYDAAGRVIKIYDNENNVLKEFNYNVVL